MKRVGTMVAVAAALLSGVIRAATAPVQSTAQVPEWMPPGPGRALIVQSCSNCHGLEKILERRGTDEWEQVIEQMAQRGAKGTDIQFDQMIDYLYEFFGPDSKTDLGEPPNCSGAWLASADSKAVLEKIGIGPELTVTQTASAIRVSGTVNGTAAERTFALPSAAQPPGAAPSLKAVWTGTALVVTFPTPSGEVSLSMLIDTNGDLAVDVTPRGEGAMMSHAMFTKKKSS